MTGDGDMIYWLIGTGIIISLFLTFVMQVVWGLNDDDKTDDGL